MLDTSTICTTVAISTPASAASGILDTQPVATRTTSRSASDCVIAPRRERPPLRTFTAVRAIAAVAGTPPKNGVTTLATPWPKSSRLGS